MLQHYHNRDCIELVIRELESNPTFLALSGEKQREYFLKIDKHAEFIKYDYESNLAGFIACYCNDYESKKAFITLVLVDHKYRGLGISKRMFSQLFTFLKNKGFYLCSLEVKLDNEPALNLYKALGFEVFETSDKNYTTMCIKL
ncbi:GNAT family N-acetyltransferase [Acinetobacter sp. WCHAc060033]|uniref:GNAT family N-acetyltransferase n=1 Tax=Acinetobacter sp. WCHAc060033 TaxID=2518624 RepID=UPI0013EE65D1|nr:GNAT family N-acetyltransferase [Acinetobacter sp. WCHAc060033]